MRRQPFSKAREEFIDDSEKKLRELVIKLQNKFNTASIDYLIENLRFKDGKVSDTNINFNIISKLDKAVNEKMKPFIDELIKWIVKRIRQLTSLNEKYFKKFGGTEAQKDRAQSKVLKSMGASISDGKLSVQKGGLLEGLVDLTEPNKRIKTIARAAVTAGLITTVVLKSNVGRAVKGRGKLGVLESRFHQQANNVFTKVDRGIQRSVSSDLGFRAAVWQGGLITTSRPICVRLNNTVITFDELEALRNQDWQGKPDVYDPFIDVGGIGCRHVLDFISDELAIILRPELKERWGL